MGDFDIPWIYVAMVAIIFVRWLLGQFKRAAQIRERKRTVARRGWDETPPEHSPVYHPKVPFEGEQQQPEPARPPQPEPSAQPQTIQELFEMRRREIAEAQRRITPPPVPVRRKEEEKPPPPKVEPRPVEVPKLKPLVKAGSRKESKITEVFGEPDKLRDAIILREILGKPKGLKL